MKIFDNISLLEHISQERKPWQANTSHAKFHAHPEDNTPSLLVYIHSNTYANFTKINESTWKVMWWSILDYEINENNKTSHEAILYLKDKYKIVDEKKLEKVKQPKRKELITNFTNIKASWNNDISILNTFLSAKWFGYKFLQDNQKVFEELSQEIWVYPWLFLSEDAWYWDVIIFPCKDSNNNLIWWKIRRKDCELIWDCKSVAIWWMTTWLMYSSLDNFKQYAIIVEWETDYITLKLLWFKNVIWNLAWVSWGTDIIKELTKKTKKIFCLYDNDNAWIKWSQWLQRVLNRPIYLPVYPKIEWKDNYDIHDLFKMWYCKKDFQDILKGSILFPEETSNKEKTSFSFKERWLTFNDVDRVVFLDKDMAFYDTEQMTYRKKTEVADLFQIPAWRVFEKVKVIKWLTYSQNWEKWYLNFAK